MIKPPDHVIEAARISGANSPCAKSKRGVVLFDRRGGFVHARAFNGPPAPFACAGDDVCREHCRKVCVHAEQRAILGALVDSGDRERGCHVPSLELVHVKVIEGVVVAGGPPSCPECSRLVVEVGICGVWLYELPTVAVANAAGVYRADDPRHIELAAWRFYSAGDFHRMTLINIGAGSLSL